LQLALGEPGKQKFFPFVGGSREAWKQGLLKNFPGEEAALDKYIAKLKVTVELKATYILISLLLIMDNLSLVQKNIFYCRFAGCRWSVGTRPFNGDTAG